MLKYITPLFFVLLIGCSFTPLHKETKQNYHILSQVQLGNIRAEQSYIFRNYLLEELNPNRVDSKPKFILDISVAKSVDSLLVQQDTTISRSEVKVIAHYTLKHMDGKIIKSGKIRSTNSFEQNMSSYSSFTQEREAYKNALKDIVRSLKSRIIIALLNKNLIANENISKQRKGVSR